MKKILAALLASAILASPVTAAVIDFESSGTPGSYNDLDYAIDGYLFNATMNTFDVRAGGAWSYAGPGHSGNFVAMNNFGGAGEIRRADQASFTFNSLWIKNWYEYGDIDGTVSGLRDGVVVGTVAFTAANAQWREIVGNFADIDTLRIDLGPYIFAIDDIAFDEAGGTVPEPASLALIALGAAGLASARRTMRKVRKA